jgi:hypothetical protein
MRGGLFPRQDFSKKVAPGSNSLDKNRPKTGEFQLGVMVFEERFGYAVWRRTWGYGIHEANRPKMAEISRIRSNDAPRGGFVVFYSRRDAEARRAAFLSVSASQRLSVSASQRLSVSASQRLSVSASQRLSANPFFQIGSTGKLKVPQLDFTGHFSKALPCFFPFCSLCFLLFKSPSRHARFTPCPPLLCRCSAHGYCRWRPRPHGVFRARD